MAQKKVNQPTKKVYQLKKLAKRKKMQGGDSGILTKKTSNTFGR